MKVLVVAPHADDETLGVGGTIARLAAEGHHVTVAVLTGHGPDPHPLWGPEVWETVRREAVAAWEVLGVAEHLFRELPAARVAEQPPWSLNRLTRQLIDEVRPELLFVPFLHDLHRDHREIVHSLSVAWRPSGEAGRGIREIYAYETASETHWQLPYLEPAFQPNCWRDIGDTLATKLEALACYRSQIRPAPDARSLEAVEALAVWRGSQVGMRAAEAFVLLRKLA